MRDIEFAPNVFEEEFSVISSVSDSARQQDVHI